MRGVLVLVLLGGCLSGCAEVYEGYYGDPKIVGSTADTVQIKTGYGVDAMPAALAFCGSRAPELEGVQAVEAGYYSVSYYRCG